MKTQRFVAVFFLYCFLNTAFAGDFMGDLISYLQITDKVTSEDRTRLTELKAKAESSGLTMDQRKEAYRELFSTMIKLQGGNMPPARLDTLVQSAASWYCSGKTSTIERKTAKPGELGDVIKRGKGKISMIIIPDVGYEGSVFENFMNRNQNNYTMYSVTLPGFGRTALPPAFEHRSYAALRLWKNAEAAILNLIDREKLIKPALLGHQGGAYLALRIALDHPQKISKVVTLNGLLYAPIPTASKPAGNLDLQERAKMTQLFLPIELFPKPPADCYNDFLQSFSSMLCKDPERAKALTKFVALSDAHLVWDHYAELMSTDLTEEMQKFTNPLLVVPSIPDKALPPNPMNDAALKQWQTLKLSSMQIVPFEDTRAYATEDNPEKLDRVLLEFLQ